MLCQVMQGNACCIMLGKVGTDLSMLGQVWRG